jgi:hypothetical protein
MGLRTQLYIGNHGFINYPEEKLRDELKKVKYRFYNLRSSFIVKARPVMDMLPDIARSMDPWEAREFLVENVKGIGYKEASHFLRNVGVFRFAILDKHIILCLPGWPGSKDHLAFKVSGNGEVLPGPGGIAESGAGNPGPLHVEDCHWKADKVKYRAVLNKYLSSLQFKLLLL